MKRLSGSIWQRLLLLLLILVGANRHFCEACFGGQRQPARVDENPMTEWSEWSECSLTCGDGKQTRMRSSVLIPAGKEFDSRACGTACVETFEWSAWGSWSSCSATCGNQGVTTRYRACIRSSDGRPEESLVNARKAQSCLDDWLQTEACNQIACPVAVSWSGWSSWTDCTKTCGSGGLQSRNRQCLTKDLEPAPASANCSLEAGGSEETRSCNDEVVCPSVAEWQPWSEWSPCSASCGPGAATRSRERRCRPDVPPSSCIEPGAPAETQSTECNLRDCPKVNGGWGDWRPWSNCLVTCGYGTRSRNRHCNNPPPSGGGADCVGVSVSSERCLGGECAVDGQWGAWSSCPMALGGPGCRTSPPNQCLHGKLKRCRKCDDPKPEFGGSPCVTGLASVQEDCWNIEACDNSKVQPPMNFTILGFLNSSDLLITWRRAPYGLPASSFFLTWSVLGKTSKGDTDILVVNKDQQEVLGETYRHWLRGLSPGDEVEVAIATRSNAGGVPTVSTSLHERFRVSRVDGGWGQWSLYSDCSPTSDCNIPGWHTRTRVCDNPKPANGGHPCVGSASETSRCFHIC